MELLREQIKTQPLDEGLGEKASQAKAILGYEGLQKKHESGLLIQAMNLRFKPELVEKYKADKIAEVHSKSIARKISYIAWSIAALCIPVLIVTGIVAEADYVIIISGLTLFLGLVTGGIANDLVVEATWERHKIKDYKGTIPEFAIQTAINLKTRCPWVEIFIEELHIGYRPSGDPFLVVLDNETWHYLEVWDETVKATTLI